MKVYALYNIKGGVGKTASAVNLAYLSTLSGAQTLVWDLDPQGAATFYFRIRPKIKGGGGKLLKKKRLGKLHRHVRGTDFEGLDLLPADFSYRHLDLALDATKDPARRLALALDALAGEYHRVFLDCAPGMSLTSESIFHAADALLVPTIPTPLSLRTLEQLDRHLRREGPEDLRVLPFFTMVDRRKKLHREVVDSRSLGLRRVSDPLATSIPYASAVEQMGLERAPLHAFDSASPGSRAYWDLWLEIESRKA